MVDHIYGRSESLVPAERPHMFAKEMVLYVDYFEELAEQAKGSEPELRKLKKFKKNLEDGMSYCLEIAESKAYQDENLASIHRTAEQQQNRLNDIFKQLLIKKVPAAV